MDFRQPILLQPDNFTPPTRTPWGGTNIIKRYKACLPDGNLDLSIGESWEFSCDPSFPSRLLDHDTTLTELIRSAPAAILGPQWSRYHREPSSEILLKLLDAGDNLSLQVHPRDDDTHLAPSECGKPESWLILESQPGAGIYLGFSRSISRGEMRSLLSSGEFSRELLQFVPVEPGDYFEIAPGVAHAIGAGVTLLEPQRILPGKTGKTYRMWDWNRRYDDAGNLSTTGQPRQLHIEESLALIDSEHQVGLSYVEGLRRRPLESIVGHSGRIMHYPKNDYYQLTICSTEDEGVAWPVSLGQGYGVVTVLRGEASIDGSGRFYSGMTMLLANQMEAADVEVAPHSMLSLVRPAYFDR